MCALLKNILPFLFVLSIILSFLLSLALYDQLLLLGMESYSATGITFIFCCFFCILVVALVNLLDSILTPVIRPTSPPSTSPSSSTSASSSPPNMDLPPSYRLLMEVEKGELPSYEEATK